MKTKVILSLLCLLAGAIFVLSLIAQDKNPFQEIWERLTQHDSQIVALQNNTSGLRSSLNNALSRIDALESRMGQAESNISTLQTSVDNLKSRIVNVGDVTLDTMGMIPVQYRGLVGKLYLKDVPYIVLALKQLLGVSSLTLADITAHVRCLGLAVETYDAASPTWDVFTGFRFARVLGPPTGTNETDINWDIMVTCDVDGTIEDVNVTYKLIHVTAYLK